MGFLTALTRLNPEKVLKVIVLIEMLFWSINAALSVVVYFQYVRDQSVLHSIEAKYGSKSKSTDAHLEYEKMKESWKYSMEWLVITALGLFIIQLFLYCGVRKKNRCMVFCWILFCVGLGITRIVVVAMLPVSAYIKYMSVLWLLRCFYIYVALKYMLKLTNEKMGREEVEPPEFRTQTDDPRLDREGFNYPVYPRSLEFADRVVGVNKDEHSHPKRWEPTYDAFDSDGRMVVVVDDPNYEAL